VERGGPSALVGVAKLYRAPDRGRGPHTHHGGRFNRSKVGRMARLKGQVEKVEALESERIDAAHAELAQKLAGMRQQKGQEAAD
jgi:hypothetical protein